MNKKSLSVFNRPAVLALLVGFVSLSFWSCSASQPLTVKITPLFETAGVIIETKDASLPLRYRDVQSGDIMQAHHLTQYDANHAATSLFHLKPNHRYELLIDGQAAIPFKTLPETSVPAPLAVVALKPGESIQKAVKQAVPGTHIHLTPGHYDETVIIDGVHGSAEHPIVISGVISEDEKKKPIQSRQLPSIAGKGKDNGIIVKNSSHLIIQHVKVQDCRSTGVQIDSSQWVTFQHSQAYDNSKWYNVWIGGGGIKNHHVFVQFNHVADLKHPPFTYTHKEVEGVTYYGIVRDHHAGWASVIRGNLIEGHSDGIHSSSVESDAPKVVEDHPNVIGTWVDYESDIYDNVIRNSRDDGIETDGISVNQRIFRNTVINSTNPLSISPSLPGPYFFLHNRIRQYSQGGIKINTAVGRGTIRNIYFYHNTFSRELKTENGKGAIITLWDGTPSKHIVLRNNIFYGPERAIVIQQKRTHKPDYDYNLWFSKGSPTHQCVWWGNWFKTWSEGWQKTLGHDVNGVWADPMLDDNLRPGSNSPALNKGVLINGINAHVKDGKPDLGAFEL